MADADPPAEHLDLPGAGPADREPGQLELAELAGFHAVSWQGWATSPRQLRVVAGLLGGWLVLLAYGAWSARELVLPLVQLVGTTAVTSTWTVLRRRRPPGTTLTASGLTVLTSCVERRRHLRWDDVLAVGVQGRWDSSSWAVPRSGPHLRLVGLAPEPAARLAELVAALHPDDQLDPPARRTGGRGPGGAGRGSAQRWSSSPVPAARGTRPLPGARGATWGPPWAGAGPAAREGTPPTRRRPDPVGPPGEEAPGEDDGLDGPFRRSTARRRPRHPR